MSTTTLSMTIRHNRGQSVHVHRRNNNQETIPLADDRLMSKYVDSCLARVCAAGGTRDASLILSIALAATVTRIQILSLVLLNNLFFFFRFFLVPQRRTWAGDCCNMVFYWSGALPVAQTTGSKHCRNRSAICRIHLQQNMFSLDC